MRPDLWQRAKELFQSALAVCEDDRRSFLREKAAGDPELLAEALSLLENHRTDSTFLSTPPELSFDEPDVARGAHIGPYRVERALGRGGMGIVYLAVRDDDVYRKEVAVKLIQRGMLAAHVVSRFRNERQILAQLDHPGIARLLDGGTTGEGHPYLVMERVVGEPITRYCEVRNLSNEARLQLFRRVCEAVAYAHQNLVVHRDLKPGNILVSAEGQPKLLDFGIAKMLDPTSPGEEVTVTVVRALTPEYASPEQVEGKPITTASDVYSLGVLLHELLTGKRPPPEPTKPSAVSAKAELAGDLDTIVLKALQKEPPRRYGSVEQLSEDVRRHLEGLPVLARPDTLSYRVSKFVRRHRAGVAAATFAIVSLFLGFAAAIWQARVAERERAKAQKRFADVRTLAGSFLFEFHDAIYGLQGSLPAKKLIVERGLQYLETLAEESESDPELRIELARAYFNLAGIQGEAWRAQTLGDSKGAMSSMRRGLELLGTVDASRLDDSQERAKAREAARILEAIAHLEMMMGDVPGALESFNRMIDLHQALARNRPFQEQVGNGVLQAYQSVGDGYWYAGDWARAEKYFETAVEASKRSDESWLPPGIVVGELGSALWRVGLMRQLEAAITMARLGDARGRESLLAGAEKAHGDGLDARAACLAVEPENAFYRRLLGESYQRLGQVLASRGRIEPARERFREALALQSATGEPWALVNARLDWIRSPARESATELGMALQALETANANSNPTNDQVPHGLGVAREDVADVYLRRGDVVPAEKELRSALASYELALEMNPTRGDYFADVSRTASRLAELLPPAEARELGTRVRALLEARAKEGKGFAPALIEVAWHLLSSEPSALRDPKAALAYAERAAAQPPGDTPDGFAVLAGARFLSGDRAGSVDAATRVYELLPLAAAGRDRAALRRDILLNLESLAPGPVARFH